MTDRSRFPVPDPSKPEAERPAAPEALDMPLESGPEERELLDAARQGAPAREIGVVVRSGGQRPRDRRT